MVPFFHATRHVPQEFPVRPIFASLCVLVCLGACAPTRNHAAEPRHKDKPMQLGNFSVSLAVKDLAASRAFYEKLGFRAFGGDAASGWLILQNETATIGLFQGMFEKNMLTFNPGWDRSANTLAKFDDVRDLQTTLKQKGIQFATQADESSTGPASFVIMDPDGNPILVDQHVPRAGK
jgi:catechol 2,3-dioxygenase-like lactoylglutathione lyase family enzyme